MPENETVPEMRERLDGLRERPGDQRLPIPNQETSCQQRFMDWVSETAPARMALGVQRYGTLLQPFNGRDFGRDALEELFDLSVYMQGLLVEREALVDLVADVANGESGTKLQQRASELLVSMGQSAYVTPEEPEGDFE